MKTTIDFATLIEMNTYEAAEMLLTNIDNDVAEITRLMKQVAAEKCRCKKMAGKKTFTEDMAKIIAKESIIKLARSTVMQKQKTTSDLTAEDIEEMDYEQTKKALLSVQSKKSRSQWLTAVAGDNDEYRDACRIEEMLKTHRDVIAPASKGVVSRRKLVDLIERMYAEHAKSKTAIAVIDEFAELTGYVKEAE